MGVTGAHLGPSQLLGSCAGVCCRSLPAPLQLSSPAADLASELLDALLCFPELCLHPAASQNTLVRATSHLLSPRQSCADAASKCAMTYCYAL